MLETFVCGFLVGVVATLIVQAIAAYQDLRDEQRHRSKQ